MSGKGAMSPRTGRTDRERLQALVESARFQSTITALIVLNAITLGLETWSTATAYAGDVLYVLDRGILGIFIVEMLIKLGVYRTRFPRDPWNVFDFVVIAVGAAPTGQGFSILRALRVLRVLRLIAVVPSMRRVVQALLSAVPGMTSIIALLGLVFYVAAVMATKLFGAAFPEWFGTIGTTMYSLFQIMTLDDWSPGIVRPVMDKYPYAWAFFVPFIIVTAVTVLNLFIAVIVNAMESEVRAQSRVQESRYAAERRDEAQRLEAELQALRAEVTSLRDLLQRQQR